MNKRGFLLVDSLVSLFVVSSVCLLCVNIFYLLDKYYDGYSNYLDKDNEFYDDLFSFGLDCTVCVVSDE